MSGRQILTFDQLSFSLMGHQFDKRYPWRVSAPKRKHVKGIGNKEVMEAVGRKRSSENDDCSIIIEEVTQRFRKLFLFPPFSHLRSLFCLEKEIIAIKEKSVI